MASLEYKHRQKTSPFSRTWAWVMLKMFCKSTPSVSSADSPAAFTLRAEGLPKALWSRLAVTVQTQQTLLSLRPVPEPRARIQRKSLGPRSSHAQDERGFDTACNRTTSPPLPTARGSCSDALTLTFPYGVFNSPRRRHAIYPAVSSHSNKSFASDPGGAAKYHGEDDGSAHFFPTS